MLDKSRLLHKIGTVSQQTIGAVESCVLFTMGMI
jgi:hypothetical protein